MKPSSFIDDGTKAKTIISDLDNGTDKNRFYSSCQKCYIAALSYLQNNLPFNNKIIEYSQYLHPQKRSCSASICASNLCSKIMKEFGSKAPKIFELPLDSTSDSIVDVVRQQWKMYQLEHITESMYMVENETRKNNIPNSYWNYALEHSGLFQERPMEESRYVRIDIYWYSINGILNEFGKPKYTQLFALVKAILSLSNANIIPERGFSINKYLLSIHGNSIDEKAIVAQRLVKDFIFQT